ncbi:MAG: hypothetical protein KBS97_01885 [Firmicutes bacterium]|nr:hypothetical protein [Candidatus Fiminaster equi]
MKKGLLIALSSVLALSGAGAIVGGVLASRNNVSGTEVKAETTEFVPDTPLKPSYYYNEKLTMPSGKIKITDKGSEVSVDVKDYYLVYPNGNTKKSAEFLLDQAGLYTLVVIGDNAGSKVTANVTFNVFKTAFSVTSESSSFEYKDEIVTYRKPTKGIEAKLKEGDSFYYNQPINVNGLTTADEPIITLSPHIRSLLTESTKFEAYFCVIRLTDFYDSSNYIDISFGQNCSNSTYGTYHYYALGKTAMQAYTGLEKNASGGIKIDGENYRLHSSGTNFGAYLTDNWGSISTSEVPKEYQFINAQGNLATTIHNTDDCAWEIYYESATNRLYVKDKQMHIITDLDEPTIYGNNLFKGFTTGDVLVSVSFNTYEEPYASLDILGFRGRSGEQLKDELIYDVDAPVIYLEKDINNFSISTNEPFAIPEAHATDLNLVGEIEKEVFYEYGTNLQVQVPVEDDTFTPLKPGNYSIIYRARDAFDNVSTLKVDCSAKTTIHNKTADLIVDKVTSVKAGQVLTLPDYELTTLNEGKNLECFAIFEDGTVSYAKDNTIFFNKVGKYEICYIYGDDVVSNTLRYEIEAIANNEFHYVDGVNIPRYLIKDSSFSILNYDVTLVSSKDLPKAKPQVYADFGSGYQLVNNPDQIFVNATSDKASIKLEYNGKTLKEVTDIPVVDVGFSKGLSLENYFVGNIDKESTATSVNLSLKDTSGSSKIDFINPINFASFDLEFEIGTKNYENLIIRFEDVDNPNNIVDFTVKQGAAIATFYAGSDKVELSSNSIRLSYSSVTRKLNVNSANNLLVEDVFPKGKVYLSFIFEGLFGNENLKIKQIDDQMFFSGKYDGTPARIFFRDISGNVQIGSEIHIKDPIINDVLCPYLLSSYKITVKLSKADGSTSFVKSTTGVTLDGNQSLKNDISFVCNEYGTIYVSMEYADQFGNNRRLTNALFINDSIAPTITINNGVKENSVKEVKFGDTVTVEGYSVSDDVSSPDKIVSRVYAMSPSLAMVQIKDSKFVASEYGDYHICYFAKDEAGNVSTVSYIVRVR